MSFVGNLGQAADSSSIVAKTKLASRYEAAVSFNALTMTFIAGTDFGPGDMVRLGIYSDDGGEPDVLLGFTGEIEGLAIEDGAYHADLNVVVAIVAGEFYWLAVHSETAYDARATSTATGDSREVSDDEYSDGLSYEFGSGSSETVALCVAALTRTRGGFCRGSLLYGGAVMQDRADVVWGVVRSETGDVVVYKNLGGAVTAVLMAAATPTEIFGSAATAVGWVDAAMDGEGVIQIVCQPATALNTRDVAYGTFDMNEGTFGAWEEAAALTGQQQAAANATAVTVGHRSRLNG